MLFEFGISLLTPTINKLHLPTGNTLRSKLITQKN